MRPAGVKPMSRTNAPVRKVTLLAAGLPKSVRTCARRCHSAQGCPLRLGIGYLQRGDNRPGTHMGWGGWGQAMWLSNRDLCQAMERSVMAGGIGFAVLNLMSDNPGMRWDIETTKRTDRLCTARWSGSGADQDNRTGRTKCARYALDGRTAGCSIPNAALVAAATYPAELGHRGGHRCGGRRLRSWTSSC